MSEQTRELWATGAFRYERECDCGTLVHVFASPSKCRVRITVFCTGCKTGIQFEIGEGKSESKEKGLESAHEEEDRPGEPPIEAKVVEDDVQKQETTEEAAREEGTQKTEPEGELPEEPEHDKVHGEVSAEIEDLMVIRGKVWNTGILMVPNGAGTELPEAESESKGYYCPWCDHTAKLGVGCHGKICCIMCGKPINSRFADLLKKARQWDYVIMREPVTSAKAAQYLGTSTSWAGKVLRELGWEQTRWRGVIWWRWNPPKENGK